MQTETIKEQQTEIEKTIEISGSEAVLVTDCNSNG